LRQQSFHQYTPHGWQSCDRFEELQLVVKKTFDLILPACVTEAIFLLERERQRASEKDRGLMPWLRCG
jgi:hypothetical protein